MHHRDNLILRILGQNTMYEKRDGQTKSDMSLDDFVELHDKSYRDLTENLNRLLKGGYVVQEDHPLRILRILTLTPKGVEHFEKDMEENNFKNTPLDDIVFVEVKPRIQVTTRTNWVKLEHTGGEIQFLPERLITDEILETVLFATFTRNRFMDDRFEFHNIEVDDDEELQPDKKQAQKYLDIYYE